MVRISLLLVIAFGLLGYMVALQSVEVDLTPIQTAQQAADEAAWMDLLATLGEEALQLFLGFAAD